MPDTQLPENNLCAIGQCQSKSNLLLGASTSLIIQDEWLETDLDLDDLYYRVNVNANGKDRIIQLSKGRCEPVEER